MPIGTAYLREKISIHALRGEGASHPTPTPTKDKYFNPRPPWGGRREVNRLNNLLTYFNPRPPWGGRQYKALCGRLYVSISIHALRGEGDLKR